MKAPTLAPLSVTPEFLAGGGELGQRIRDYDWSKTSLGPVDTWPQSLRTCIRIMLTSRQPIWIGWGKDLIKFYNDPYKAIVGGKHPRALGSPASVVWKDIWQDIEPLLKKVMEQDEGTYVESQLLIMERNGYPEETYYTFSYTPIPGDDGRTAGMFCANTDDTDRIISERQLKTLTQLGKRLTDCHTNEEVIGRTIATLNENPHDFPFALFRKIENNKAILVNSTPMGASGVLVKDVIHLDEDGVVADLIKKTISTREMQVMEDITRKVGNLPMGTWTIPPDKAIVMPILHSVSKEPYGLLAIGLNPYRLLDEKYSAFFSLVADQVATSFADVHVLEEERKRAEALAEIDRAKTIFFSNISHEFRTPLTLLLGPIEEALDDPDNERNKQRMDLAYRNALRMQKLVNTLLEFSRLEAGRVDGRFSKVDIATFTEDLASTFRSAVEQAGMQLNITPGEIKSDVYVDVDMWEKIVLNLISNAFKYTTQGSISINIAQLGSEIRLEVADTGIGIPADQLDKVFERFHRVDNMQGRSGEGTGIGLSMVKELVRLHKGNISVESTPGKGSTFIVTFPAGKDHLPEERLADATASVSKNANAFVQEALKWIPQDNGTPLSGAQEKPVVLLADDNADMREYVCRLLEEDFTIVTASDGQEAYDKLAEYRPALLISDMMMPKLNGFELLQKVRGQQATRSIPVIFLSARAGEEAKVEGLEAGADDYLVKPFSAKELLVRVHNQIRMSQVRRETEQQFYQLFLQAPALIHVLKGPDHVFEFFHPKGKELVGGRDLTGMTVREALPEYEGQGFFELLDMVYNTGNPIIANEKQSFLANEKGELIERYFNFIYQPWRDLHGKVQGVLNFAVDVTETVIAKKKIEEEVRKRTAELQRSNNELQQFAHVASHDLKEPLRKIKIFAGCVARESGNSFTEKTRVYIDKINAASDRMLAMVEGVLNYSVVNGNEQQIEPVNLNTTFRNIEADLELPIAQKQAVIRYKDLPTVDGASLLLYQLFYNLVNNSLKFSRPGVAPVIEITAEFGIDHKTDWVIITLRDNGLGFEQEYAEKIFESFARLNSKDQFEGTGLGLSLCKRIAERHGGFIHAQGTPGEGALFTIVLPATQHTSSL